MLESLGCSEDIVCAYDYVFSSWSFERYRLHDLQESPSIIKGTVLFKLRMILQLNCCYKIELHSIF